MAKRTGSRLKSDNEFMNVQQLYAFNPSFKDSKNFMSCRLEKGQLSSGVQRVKDNKDRHYDDNLDRNSGNELVAKGPGSRLASDADFWETKPERLPTSNNNFGGLSVWCDKNSISRLTDKVRVGDRLEFINSNLPRAHWGIYVDELKFLPWSVVHFIPGTKEGRAYSALTTYLHISLPSSNGALVVNSIYKFVSLPGDEVRINNSTDKHWPPVSTGHIRKEISYQLKDIHKWSVLQQVYVHLCRVSFKESEDFVDYCRYDRDHQHYMCLLNGEKVTEWYSKSSIDYFISEVRVGDRLEFAGRQSPYDRWGIYIGQWGVNFEQVALVTPSDENDETSSGATLSSIGSSAKPKQELRVKSIGTVLGNDQVRINNERDHTLPPLVRTDILDEINRLLPGKTHRYACKVSFNNAKDFVNYCRYEDWRINFGLVSDWCESGQSLPQLHVGDRLEFNRTALPYTHWGIYVGDWGDDHHQVVHLAPADGNGKIFSKKKSSGSGPSSKNRPEVCVNNIWAVTGSDKVRINNIRDETWPPLVRTAILDEIVHHLKSQSDGHKPMYNLFRNNCEHFVNHCRYGKHHSDQVSLFSIVRDLWKTQASKDSTSN
ncbi:uncharacterized protein LOC119725463 [Patiria miniata]|uniref:LRAT domain-containing protein n=1 Tax=Patiria miniata TaxID=46514 RepID=A0A913ZM11_PATMI|nr:uncharacterized protein LOC119725463 [Patiria miniata]